jgi:C-terminal processing protease CtpA/Prc
MFTTIQNISLFSKNHGLHLILNDVMENGPAWESGVRAGDVIVTINDWLIVLMDRPQVGFILYLQIVNSVVKTQRMNNSANWTRSVCQDELVDRSVLH